VHVVGLLAPGGIEAVLATPVVSLEEGADTSAAAESEEQNQSADESDGNDDGEDDGGDQNSDEDEDEDEDGDEQQEDDNDQFGLAWEWLECARVIFLDSPDHQQQLAETYDLLGNLALETGMYVSACSSCNVF
jgi:hypothetical protein